MLVQACAQTSTPAVVAVSEANPIGEADGKAAYSVCAACHLPDGSGVPSAFPPLRNRIPSMASSDAGRAYLVNVVSNGLKGRIDVDGQMFFGVMQGFKATKSPQDIADVLNYTATFLRDNSDVAFIAFTANEVVLLQEKNAEKSAISMRSAVVK